MTLNECTYLLNNKKIWTIDLCIFFQMLRMKELFLHDKICKYNSRPI